MGEQGAAEHRSTGSNAARIYEMTSTVLSLTTGIRALYMQYILDLVQGNLQSLTSILKQSIADKAVCEADLLSVLKIESKPVPEGEDIYSLSAESQTLFEQISKSSDSDVLVIVKKIVRSTKYAAITWYTASGFDSNPHHLPIKKFNLENTSNHK
jgi:hypothetical protein